MVSKDEFKTLVKAMKAAYPNQNFIPDRDAFDVWYVMLQRFDYMTLQAAIQAHMASSEKLPTIAGLTKFCTQSSRKGDQSGIEVWPMVERAICNSIYNSRQEFDKLPDIAKKVLGSPDVLRSMAMSENYNAGVEKSLFIRRFDEYAARQAVNTTIPADALAVLDGDDHALLEG